MAVRVRIKLCTIHEKKLKIETNALVNTGYETEEPEILIPVALAEALRIWPELPAHTRVQTYTTAAGMVKLYRLSGFVSLQLKTDKLSGSKKATLVISEHENEVLLSDALISKLNIVIEDAQKGWWRFKDEPEKIRKSQKPQTW